MSRQPARPISGLTTKHRQQPTPELQRTRLTPAIIDTPCGQHVTHVFVWVLHLKHIIFTGTLPTTLGPFYVKSEMLSGWIINAGLFGSLFFR